MSLKLRIILALLVVLAFCYFRVKKQVPPNALLKANGTTIASRFLAPAGYTRVTGDSLSFAVFLQQQKLKSHGYLVHYYDGHEKPNKVAAAVLDADVGNKDLQQCADAVMRLRAEYLWKTKQYDLLHFNFTSGFKADYKKWRQGYRISVKGNSVSWIKTNKESHSYSSFRDYLNTVFTYAGTASLAKELKPIALKDMQIGDVFIKGGSPGHAVIVVDMAVNKAGRKVYMVAQSYMPAQDIHVLSNYNNTAISPWYELNVNVSSINTPEWTFEPTQLMRF